MQDQKSYIREVADAINSTPSAKTHRVPQYVVHLVREKTYTLPGERPKAISNPAQAARIALEPLQYADREVFGVLMLTAKNGLIGWSPVSVGTLNASIVHPREIFKPAILAGAASVILMHNHPSGDPTPSPEDIEVTKRLVDAGSIIGITIRDHIVIGDGCFFSFKEKALL